MKTEQILPAVQMGALCVIALLLLLLTLSARSAPAASGNEFRELVTLHELKHYLNVQHDFDIERSIETKDLYKFEHDERAKSEILRVTTRVDKTYKMLVKVSQLVDEKNRAVLAD